VVLGHPSMGRPAGVGDARGGVRLRLARAGREVGHAADGPHPVDAAVQRGEAGGVVTAILELAQALDEDGHDVAPRDGPYDSAHLAGSLDSPVLVVPVRSFRVSAASPGASSSRWWSALPGRW